MRSTFCLEWITLTVRKGSDEARLRAGIFLIPPGRLLKFTERNIAERQRETLVLRAVVGEITGGTWVHILKIVNITEYQAALEVQHGTK